MNLHVALHSYFSATVDDSLFIFRSQFLLENFSPTLGGDLELGLLYSPYCGLHILRIHYYSTKSTRFLDQLLISLNVSSMTNFALRKYIAYLWDLSLYCEVMTKRGAT